VVKKVSSERGATVEDASGGRSLGRGKAGKVIAIGASRRGARALACCANGAVYVLDLRAIACEKGGGEQKNGVRALATSGAKPAACAWWTRKFDRDRNDREVGICVGVDGEVRLWDIDACAPLGALVIEGKCASAELARGRASQSLFVRGCDGETRTLVLERETRAVKVAQGDRSKVEREVVIESLPGSAGLTAFAAHAVKDEYGARDGRVVDLSVQDDCDGSSDDDMADGVSLIAAVIDKSSLELYDVDVPGTPKSTHALPKHTVSVHVTNDLIFALVREPVFGEEDLTDITSFTARVHVLARRGDGRMITLQTMRVPRSAGVPRKLFAGPFPRRVGNARVNLRGCMLWTSTGVFAIEATMGVSEYLRSFMTTPDAAAKTDGVAADADDWASDIAENETAEKNALTPYEKLKEIASALNEDYAPVLIDAVREELRRREFAKASVVFKTTGKPWNEFIALALDEWDATQALAHFISQPAAWAPYGSPENLAWLEIASAVHAQLHAWCQASTTAALGATAEMHDDIASKLKALRLESKPLTSISLEKSVDTVLRVASEGLSLAKDDVATRDAAASAFAAVVALEAAKAVTAIVNASCAKDYYSPDVKALFTLLLSSSSVVESLHMLGEITANAIADAERTIELSEGGVINSWKPKPLVFWDANVTYYYAAPHSKETMADVVSVFGLNPGTAEANVPATPATPMYDALRDDELEQLASIARAAVERGARGARVIEIAALLRLPDDNALLDAIKSALDADVRLYSWALGACLERRKHRTATEIAMKMLDYSSALSCHLEHVKDLAIKGEVTKDAIRQELEHGLKSYVEPISSTPAQARAIECVIECWHQNALPMEDLERVLLEGVVSRGHAAAMQKVLQSGVEDVALSGRFVLAVAARRLAEEDEKYTAKEGAAIETIWSQIKENLIIGMNTSVSVQTKPFTADELEAMSGDDGAPECWVFTCGHRLVGSDFKRAVHESKTRLGILDLPMTSHLLESDFALRKCAMACPSCVTASIERRVEIARNPES